MCRESTLLPISKWRPGLEASPSELRGGKKQQKMAPVGARGPLSVVQAVVPLHLPAEALRDGLGSELWGVACPSDRELVLSKRKQKSWSGGSLGAGKWEQRLRPVFQPVREEACISRREGPFRCSGSRPCHHTVTSFHAARKSPGDQHSLLGCGS